MNMNKKDKKKTLFTIIITILIFIVILIYLLISNIVNYVTDPQRAVDWHASQMYKDAVELFDSGHYDEALIQLDSIDSTWTNMKKASSLKTDVVREVLLEDADALLAEGNYAELLKYISTHVDDPSSDTDIKAIFDNAADVYREDILDQAFTAYTEHGADGPSYALAILNDALNCIPDDQIIKSEMAEYEACFGENLVYMDPFHEGDGIYRFSGDPIADVEGISYDTGITGYSSSGDNNYISWRLDGEYDRLTATVFICNSDRNEEGSGRFTIYADDVPIYTETIDKDTESFDIDVNIKGCDILKIEAFGAGGPFNIDALTCNLGNICVSKTKSEALYYE